MLTVADLAKKVDVTPETVRHYVRIGLLSPERNQSNGYKIFNGNDIRRIRFIRQAKSLGFTLKEIGKILECSLRRSFPCPQLGKIIERRIIENKSKLEELIHLQRRMEGALKEWEDSMSDAYPDASDIYRFIESVM